MNRKNFLKSILALLAAPFAVAKAIKEPVPGFDGIIPTVERNGIKWNYDRKSWQEDFAMMIPEGVTRDSEGKIITANEFYWMEYDCKHFEENLKRIRFEYGDNDKIKVVPV